MALYSTKMEKNGNSQGVYLDTGGGGGCLCYNKNEPEDGEKE